jgi:hypothetical protein
MIEEPEPDNELYESNQNPLDDQILFSKEIFIT